MSTDLDPRATYARALGDEQACLARLRRWHRGVVWARIASLGVLVVQAGQACSRGNASWGGATATAVVFVALSVAIAVIERRLARHEARARYCEAGQARLDERNLAGSDDGKRFLDPAHPYAVDLDLFGPASLFSRLCAARTSGGQQTLADWLTGPASTDTIEERQRALAELRSRFDLRRDLWLAGGLVGKQVREEALAAWLAAPVTRVGLLDRLAAAGLGALGLCALYAFVEPRYLGIAAIIVLGQRLFGWRHRSLTQAVQASYFQRAYELRVVARVAELLQPQPFADPHLQAVVARLSDDGQPASRHIVRLLRLVDWLESRRNQLFAIVAWALVLPEQLSFAIEAWRTRHGRAAARWLAAIGELEALASLATFSFEHPDYVFPQMLRSGEPPRLAATEIGHPLIPAKTRVCNDVRLDASCQLLVVTGSNMSGKSTLLRTVGVNAVLAQAGAPVCARQMTLTPLQIGASLRAQDSLEQGISRFFAEIKRLRAILDLATHPPPVLFLLDEILNGTNSLDRHEGAEAVVRLLLERGALGLVTTHDLALSELANGDRRLGANIHFRDSLEGDRLVFDYRIRPGVVSRRNALDLMRLVGIDVPARRGPARDGPAD